MNFKKNTDFKFAADFWRSFPKGPNQPGILFSECPTTPVPSPEFLIWSDSLERELNLPNPSQISLSEKLKWLDYFSGNTPDAKTFATRYGGHQFGHWAGPLGDGRALFLGTLQSFSGPMEIQLKGAGPTPYSRHADGRAVLRSSLREFLCSEAMHFLGVSTTRALTCVNTGQGVLRDMLYDGHPELEPGAITTRVARSFLRFGHFELLAAENQSELMEKLMTSTIENYFPEIYFRKDLDPVEKKTLWFDEISQRTARLMVDWMRIGFVHGVMNTDNMSVLGLTMDYGPYGWQDVYDPDWTPNTTDFQYRRYCFGQQPAVARWNLARLAQAIGLPAESLSTFENTFEREYRQMSLNKLGQESDTTLWFELQDLFLKTEVDPTLFYRTLADLVRNLPTPIGSELIIKTISRCLYNPSEKNAEIFLDWTKNYLKTVLAQKRTMLESAELMDRTNPYFILRNYLVQVALDEIQTGKKTTLELLQIALQTPYEKNNTTELFFHRRPEWARSKIGCSALSCSS